MNKPQTLLDLFSTQAIQISLPLFVANLLLSALLAWILGRVYVKFGTTLSNREQFGRNFLLVTTTTMLIITIVKSSLALSLGLVGALSIIRFRAAIKEPEELSYLFLAISVGLGFGAEQTVITTARIFRHARDRGRSALGATARGAAQSLSHDHLPGADDGRVAADSGGAQHPRDRFGTETLRPDAGID